LPRIELIACDLDGTLVDSAPDLARCIDAALEHAGFAAPGEEHVRGWIGDGVEMLVHRALAHVADADQIADVYERVFAEFTHTYRRHLYDRSRLYTGVTETLDDFRSAGLQLCCITNKRVEFANALLERAGIRHHFTLVYGGDSLAGKKPEPVQLEAAARELGADRAASVMVGDSVHDQRAALAAGFRFVWAAYGYGARDALAHADALEVIARFDELPLRLASQAR
jgi:phosphoglycolate phosphatase